jgi:hypothetical protein
MSLRKVISLLPFFNGNITNGCVRQIALTDLEWHTLPTIDVEKRLTTSITDGLSADQAKRRQAEYGRNAPSPAKTHWFRTIFLYFFGGFGSILLIGCVLVFISWKPLGDPPAVANLVCAITEHTLLKPSCQRKTLANQTCILGPRNRPPRRLLYPSALQHVPGLVHIPNHVLNQGDAA